MGPPGNAWVRRGPCPRKRVAPRSLPTSWETPMPSVSPPVLSCRIHVFNPSSESHTCLKKKMMLSHKCLFMGVLNTLRNILRKITQILVFVHLLCWTVKLTRSFSLSLPRQLSNAVAPGPVPEEYLRGFRPYATTEDALRMPSLPLGMDPATAAAAAAAYYHPSYLPHPSFTPYR